MEMIQLQASARKKDLNPRALRRESLVPCVVYGKVENTQIQVDEKSLRRAYHNAGESTLVNLNLDGKEIPVLFYDYSPDPVSERPLHADFYAVDMKKEVEAQVEVKLLGEAPAVKDHGAILVTPTHSVTVKCLPANLPHELELDLGGLMEIGSVLTVAALKVPANVAIVDAPETVLVIAQEPRAEEKAEEVVAAPAEGDAAAAAAAGAAPAAEGAAPAAGDAKKEKKE